MNYSIIYYRYYVLGGLQFELNSKRFGKTMIQAIPSNSISHNKFTIKMGPKCKQTFKFEFQFEFPYPGIHLDFVFVLKTSIAYSRFSRIDETNLDGFLARAFFTFCEFEDSDCSQTEFPFWAHWFPFWDGSFKWGSRFRGHINPKTQLWHIWPNGDIYFIPEC